MAQKSNELYAKTSTLYDNIQAIYSQDLKGQLLQYFDSTIQSVNTKITSFKSGLATLQSTGVDLSKQFGTLQDQDEQADQARIQQAQQQAIADALAQERQKDVEQSWTNRLKRALWYPVQKVQDLWSWITSWWTGTKVPDTPSEYQETDTTVQQVITTT